MKQFFKISKGSAGSRSIANMVSNAGTNLSRYRAAKLMKRLGLTSKQTRSHRYKIAANESKVAPNELKREFDVKAPNTVWCGDVTYIWIGTQWAYLAVVLDLFSRKPIGWAVSLSPNTDLTAKAMKIAFEARGRPAGVMFHSDQGCHYTSKQFRDLLSNFEIKQSMSRRGNCWDNAPMERFFRSFKTEWMPNNGYHCFSAARSDINDYIFGYYSSIRPHEHNAGVSPNAREISYRAAH